MKVIIVSILFVIASCAFASAAQFDINFFNGVKWGSKINNGNGFKLVSTGTLGEKFYSRAADKNLFEGIKVEAISYVVKKIDSQMLILFLMANTTTTKSGHCSLKSL